jgi:Zn-dependent M16 (insulinase) family peptidase
MTFKQLLFTEYPDTNMTVTVYEHIKTGALHYHTQYDTTQNTFNVAFRTLPKNNNGLPHILEHSVLNGSEKFPYPAVFFSMQGRSFETFSNAMTGHDTTQYPFSTINEQGYFNLLSIYLDAVFFPQLKKEVFLQEGWRYSFSEPTNPESPLVYQGVVYNEMVGAYTNPGRVAYVNMLTQAFKNTQYENFSGGNPLEIPTLTYADFVAFHKKYYHPSNAIFYTFGSIPVDQIHEKLEDWVLSRFDKVVIDNNINTSKLNISGQTYESTHPGESGIIYFKNYQLPAFKNTEDYYTARLLMNLMQSGQNDFREVFLQSDLKATAEHMGLLPVKDSVIYVEFNMDENVIEDINTTLNNYLINVAKNGFVQQELDNMLDYFELQNREGEAFTENMGLNVINKYMSIERHGIATPEEGNNLQLVKSILKKLGNAEYVSQLIHSYFLNNDKFFNFISTASSTFGADLANSAKEQLKAVQATLTNEDKNAILEQSALLENFRKTDRQLEKLPKLELNDIVPKYPREVPYEIITNTNSKIALFNEKTNHVTYLKLYFPFTFDTVENLFYKKLSIQLSNDLNLKNKTIQETTIWKQTHLSDIKTQLNIIAHSRDDFETYVSLETKGLSEHTETIMNKTMSFTKDLSWDDHELIINSIQSLWREHLTSYQDQGDMFAINESQASLSNHLTLKKTLSREFYTSFMKEIVEKIDAKEYHFISVLEKTYRDLFTHKPTVFFCGNNHDGQLVSDFLSKLEFKDLPIQQSSLFEYKNYSKQNVLDLNTPINYVAYSVTVPAGDHIDGGKIMLLATYLQHHLLTNIREKGGAYGAKASYNPNGIFTAFSYRDPNPKNTLEVFNGLGEYLLTHEINEEQFNVSKISLLKKFNQPVEPIHEAMKQFNKTLKEQGSDPKLLMESALNMKPEEIRDLAKKYFTNNTPSISIATNKQTIDSHFNDWTAINIAPAE